MRKFRDKDLQQWVEMLRERTQNWRKSHTQGGLYFSYWGDAGDDEHDIVYLFGVNDSYSALEDRAMLEHIRNAFRKIKNLAFTTGGYNGYGGGQWLELDIANSTTKALKEAYELLHDARGRSYLTASGKLEPESWVYDAMDTEEYNEMYEKESWDCYTNWLEWDVLRGTPFEDMPKERYKRYEDLIWQEESGGGYIYNQGRTPIEQHLIPTILESLNAGEFELDQEDYEVFIDDEKNAAWPRIWQATDGKFYLETELTWSDNQWVAPSKTNTRKMFEGD